ncbi:MAG: MATE family efflux transporter [Chloroflexi bacterium]|nr:MATE family efflux transporter [Chloroflexota bacterium]
MPAVAERILTLLVNTVNTILVGHLGAAALAAVGLSGTISMIGSTLFQAVGTGSTACIAQAIGARDKASALRYLEQSMLVAAALGLACTALFLPLTRQSLIVLGAEEDVVALGGCYLPYMAATWPMMSLLMVGSAALRGAGDTRTPMWIMGGMNVLNLLLSLLLIRGWGPLPELGVMGAGIAAGVSRALAGVAIMVVLRNGRGRLRLRQLFYPADREVLSRLLQVGLPAGGENLLMRVAFLSYTRIIASLGTAAYAAHVIAQRVESLTMMPSFGFAVAATTLAGQALGAGDPRRARRSVFCAIQIAVGVALTGSLVFLAFPRLMLSLFTTDESVIVQGIIPLCILAVGQPIMTIANCLSGGLRGVGDTRSVMWITGIGAWLVRVPLAVLSVTLFSLGLPGVQASMTLDWFTRMALLAWRFRPALWDKHARSAMGRVRLSPRGTPAE